MAVSASNFSMIMFELNKAPGASTEFISTIGDVRGWMFSAMRFDLDESIEALQATGIDMKMSVDSSRPKSRLPEGFIEKITKERGEAKKQAREIGKSRNAQDIIINFTISLKRIKLFSDNSIQICNNKYKKAVAETRAAIKDSATRDYVVGILSGISVIFITSIYPTAAGNSQKTSFNYIVSSEISQVNARQEKDDFNSRIVTVLDAGEYVRVVAVEEKSYKIHCPDSEYEYCYIAKKSKNGASILEPINFSND